MVCPRERSSPSLPPVCAPVCATWPPKAHTDATSSLSLLHASDPGPIPPAACLSHSPTLTWLTYKIESRWSGTHRPSQMHLLHPALSPSLPHHTARLGRWQFPAYVLCCLWILAFASASAKSAAPSPRPVQPGSRISSAPSHASRHLPCCPVMTADVSISLAQLDGATPDSLYQGFSPAPSTGPGTQQMYENGH